MDEKDVVRDGYDAMADAYLATREDDSENVRLLDDFIRRLPQGVQVLDAGCGAGIPVTRMLSRHFDVTGVDFSEGQIARARRLVPNARFICQDMTEMDFPDAAFDGVVSYYAIIHIPRDEHPALLRNIHRMLKPGGLALLCMGAEDLPAATEEDFLGAPMYWSHYDAETNLRMLQECGFSVVWARQVGDTLGGDAEHLFVLAQKGEAPSDLPQERVDI